MALVHGFDDCWTEIFGWLDFCSLHRTAAVCKRFRDLARGIFPKQQCVLSLMADNVLVEHNTTSDAASCLQQFTMPQGTTMVCTHPHNTRVHVFFADNSIFWRWKSYGSKLTPLPRLPTVEDGDMVLFNMTGDVVLATRISFPSTVCRVHCWNWHETAQQCWRQLPTSMTGENFVASADSLFCIINPNLLEEISLSSLRLLTSVAHVISPAMSVFVKPVYHDNWLYVTLETGLLGRWNRHTGCTEVIPRVAVPVVVWGDWLYAGVDTSLTVTQRYHVYAGVWELVDAKFAEIATQYVI
eukprot:TRINITY_DN15125_c0_g1_i1.p1 TRINITY_DN15125_c0_g1~~TRINITY_DN15125_c0_g1_i1.p1  ORF type:complete len:298 (+),score=64.53 TRINITY_DN15125_c0_g1_i1:42-935(+)